jgi:3-deoxy-D-manno-octulosonate 8-phosphate phosphatase (KDO 8-P phosphatase)
VTEYPDEFQAALARVRLIIVDVDGVLTDGMLHYDAEGQPFRSFNSRDGLGLTMWRLMGGDAAIVTGLSSKPVEVIAQRWKCVSCRVNVGDKGAACRTIAEKQGVPLEQVAFIGDDILDLPALRIVGLPVAVADAHPRVLEVAQIVTETPGGRGAVRELVETLLDARDELDDAIQKYEKLKTGSDPS